MSSSAEDRVAAVRQRFADLLERSAAVSRAAGSVLLASLRYRAGWPNLPDFGGRRSEKILYVAFAAGPLWRDTTFLHGFDLATVGLGRRIAVALCLPTSAEPSLSPWMTLHRRMHDEEAHHHLVIADASRLCLVDPKMYFRTVVLCGAEHLPAVRSVVARWDPAPSLVVDREGEAFVAQVDRARRAVIAGVVADLAPLMGVRDFWRVVVAPKIKSTGDIAIVDHLTCAPNQLVLESAGLRPHLIPMAVARAQVGAKEGGAEEAGIDETLLNATLDAANTVLAERHRAKTLFRKLHPKFPEAVSLILAAPALMPEWYAPRARRDGDGTIVAEAAETVIALSKRQLGFGLPIPGHVVQRSDLFDELGMHQRLRGTELSLFAAAVGAVAVRYSAPVIRLPFGVNAAHAELADLETNVRRGEAGTRGAWKNVVVMRKLIKKLHATIASPAIEKFLQRDPLAHVKIVADAPLEWLAVDGLPLFLRHSTSRLPATPGYLLLEAALDYQLLNLKYEDLRRVLVVRSFSDSFGPRLALENAVRAAIARPLPEHLAAALGRAGEAPGPPAAAGFTQGVELTVVDVASEAELHAALNAFRGWIVMLDCHGAISPDTGHGELLIGADRVDPWTLRRRARIPPVVLLSACDTFMLRGTAASIASGFLFSGALTVLGTLFEIDAHHAARFAATVVSICCRLGPMVAAATASPMRMSWLLTWAQRQAYLEDVLDAHRSSARTVGPRLDEIIDPLTLSMARDFAWEQPVLTAIAEKLGVTRADLARASEGTHGMLAPALQYLQIGSPEAIIVEGPGDGMTDAMAKWKREIGFEPWDARMTR